MPQSYTWKILSDHKILLELINKCSKVAEYETNIQKAIVFYILAVNNPKVKLRIQFQDFPGGAVVKNGTLKTITKSHRKSLISHAWIVRLNTVKMAILSK